MIRIYVSLFCITKPVGAGAGRPENRSAAELGSFAKWRGAEEDCREKRAFCLEFSLLLSLGQCQTKCDEVTTK
jgi:hypothetical protein